MTIQDVITLADDLSPNQYTDNHKIQWLSSLDGKIFHDVILTHCGCMLYDYPDGGYTAADQELIVEEPYASDLYVAYLQSKIAAANAEIVKYNQFATLYNTAYNEWTSWYNRTHMPKTCGKWVF